MNTPRTELLIIDPQNDFCDIPGAALPVAGANADLLRLADFIQRVGRRLDGIHVTLDAHHPVDIAHPGWWEDAGGQLPAPFTAISAEAVQDGRWRARNPAWRARSLDYVTALETGGRHGLVIWPEHCLIGHWGQGIHAGLGERLNTWSRERMQPVNYVAKGSNPFTEHYSAVRAEVPDPDDPATQFNQALLAALAAADRVLIAGEALSHCVASTVRDIAARWPAAALEKLVLLTDCSSPVPGFESLAADFVAEMADRGVGLARSDTWIT